VHEAELGERLRRKGLALSLKEWQCFYKVSQLDVSLTDTTNGLLVVLCFNGLFFSLRRERVCDTKRKVLLCSQANEAAKHGDFYILAKVFLRTPTTWRRRDKLLLRIVSNLKLSFAKCVNVMDPK